MVTFAGRTGSIFAFRSSPCSASLLFSFAFRSFLLHNKQNKTSLNRVTSPIPFFRSSPSSIIYLNSAIPLSQVHTKLRSSTQSLYARNRHGFASPSRTPGCYGIKISLLRLRLNRAYEIKCPDDTIGMVIGGCYILRDL